MRSASTQKASFRRLPLVSSNVKGIAFNRRKFVHGERGKNNNNGSNNAKAANECESWGLMIDRYHSDDL